MFDFKDKVIFISGGGTGIGFSIAESFLNAGANVIVCGRRAKPLEASKQSHLRKLHIPPEKIHCLTADLSDDEDVGKIKKYILSNYKRIDAVINNSGTWEQRDIDNFDASFVNYHVNNNLKTTINGTKLASEFMINGGAIVNLGSFSALLPMKQASFYSALKSCIVSFTRSAASELASKNIRVNCVIPGVIRTPMTSDYIDSNYERIISPIALGRVGSVQDVANGILFLCSEYSSYITGTSLEITGGKYITQL